MRDREECRWEAFPRFSRDRFFEMRLDIIAYSYNNNTHLSLSYYYSKNKHFCVLGNNYFGSVITVLLIQMSTLEIFLQILMHFFRINWFKWMDFLNWLKVIGMVDIRANFQEEEFNSMDTKNLIVSKHFLLIIWILWWGIITSIEVSIYDKFRGKRNFIYLLGFLE